MGGQLIEGQGVARLNGFKVPALLLTVIGVDTKHRSMAEHQLFDARVLNVHASISEDDPIVRSMVELGVQEPVLVQVEEIDGQEHYVVIDGRGRVLRQRVANKILASRGLPEKLVPVLAQRKTDKTEKLGSTLQIVLNEHRHEDTPMNRAQKAHYLLSTGYETEQVAEMFRVTAQTIREWVKLIDLAPEVQQAVDNGVSASAAAKLHGLSREEQRTALTQLSADGGKVTVKKAAAAAKGTKNGGEPPVAAPSKRAIRKAIENGEGVLSEDVILGLRIAIGDVSPSKVKGLTALLRGDSPSDAE